MVATLQQRVEESGLRNIRCEQADIYALAYSDGEFDAVVVANVLHLVPDLPAALQALRRVIRPGGSIIAPTFCHDETWALRSLSRLVAVSDFPGHRRFTLQTLQGALENSGVHMNQAVLLPGLIPIGYVAGVIEPRPEGWERHE